MNILGVVSVYHRLFQIFALSQFNIEKKTWTTSRNKFLDVYTSCVVLLSTGILFFGLFTPTFQEPYSGDIGDTVDFIQLIGIRVAHIASIVEAVLRRNVVEAMLRKTQEIDRIFEVSLNTDVDNGKLRSKSITYGFVFFGIYVGSELCILITSVLGSNSEKVVYWVLYLIPLLACGLRYFQYFMAVTMIKQRFDKLVEVLGDVNLLQGKKADKENSQWNGVATVKLCPGGGQANKASNGDGVDLSNLLVIRDLYNRLWELTILANQCFGLSILVNVGNDFLAVTSNCYWMFLTFQSYSSSYTDFFRIAGSAVWSVPHLFNVITLAMLCHKTVESTSEIALGVHRIQIDVLNDNHNSLIEQFSLQLLHQKIHFTAFGFFTIDCTLLYTIVGATTTYLVILIQFHMSEQKNMWTRILYATAANATH